MRDVTIMSIDVARFGNEQSTVHIKDISMGAVDAAIRRKLCTTIQCNGEMGLSKFAEMVIEDCRRFNVDVVFVDSAGIGIALADILREAKLQVVAVGPTKRTSK